jgi:hypothetical protein
MEIVRYQAMRSQRLLRAWAIVWLLAIPLFHIHLETDPHHGDAGHVHGGTVHTVFSKDLDGEYGHHQGHDAVVESADLGLALSADSSHAWEEHAELGYALLNDSTDRKLLKPFLTPLLFVAQTAIPVPERRDRSEQDGASTFSSRVLVREIPARAPPSSLLG